MPGMNAVGMNTADEHERDADDRSGDFLHRLEGGFLGRKPMLDVMLDRFDDDDGVVDDQADGEHEAEERERVDGEAEQREKHERADQRNRHGQQRDQRRAPALQEDEDDEDDEQRAPRPACATISFMPSVTASVVSSETT